tara:strand:+ start:1366 stop:1794 length:429 start_codon:yes stop_codon:yes gene_type:complete
MNEKTRSTITVTCFTARAIELQAERMAISKSELANLILSMTSGAIRSFTPKSQITLGSKQPRVRGPAFECDTENINVDVSKAHAFADIAKTLRLSTTWLFEHAALDVLDRLKLVEAANRHSIGAPMLARINKLEQQPYKVGA